MIPHEGKKNLQSHPDFCKKKSKEITSLNLKIMEQPKQEEKLEEQTVCINVCIPKLVRITKDSSFWTKRKDLISKLEIKQKIVEEAKVVNNIAQVARKHGLSEDTIQYWCKKEDEISEYFFQIKLWVMFVSMYFVCISSIIFTQMTLFISYVKYHP